MPSEPSDESCAESVEKAITTRRHFLRQGTIAAVGVPVALGTLAASCAAPRAQSVPPPPPSDTEGAAPASPADSAKAIRARADEMDAHHEAGIKAFPAATAAKGNLPLAPRLERGVKVFELTCSEVSWETKPGKRVAAWAYNGQVPGPQIHAREGDRVRIVVHNQLPESTSVHFHGLEVPNDQDGVAFMTQPPIKPGESYTYEFAVPNSGSHMYHSHHNAAHQVGKGLLGAFIVAPRDSSREPKVALDYVMILNDGLHGYTLNGKDFPATEPLLCKRGDLIRIRFMNEGMMIHPMHLHGVHMTVIAKDGWPLPMPYRCDTLNIAPGERWDVLVKATNPGTWAFHCHILTHAESAQGMFGMVTALIVE